MGWFSKTKERIGKERQQDKKIKMIADELPKIYNLILEMLEELAKREKESVESAVVLRPDEKLIVIAPKGLDACKFADVRKHLSGFFSGGDKGFVFTHDFKVFVTKKECRDKKEKRGEKTCLRNGL